jgi:phosphatidylinositol alpha-1,6-mannosyltransferase
MMRSVCESADLVIANSEYTLEKLLESAPKAKAVAIPLGVNHEHFCPGDTGAAKRRFRVADKLVLSSVSRLEGYKGHDVVLRAIAACSECIRERLVYLIAGKGPHRGALEQQVVELGLSNQVRFLGFVPEENLPDLYRASDLFVICSREIIGNQDVEGFGLVFLEAQSCGTPVVGSRTGGIPDAVKDGHGGWLIAQDDSAMLARIVTSLAEDPERFRKAGQEARRRIELDCTWDKYMSRFASALKANGISVC